MNFRKNKKRKTDVEEVDITSLLDILVILLVFLLKSFNDSELTVDLVTELALPYSLSQGRAHAGVVLQVNKKQNIFVNNKLLGNLKSPGSLSKLQKELSTEYKKINLRKKEAVKEKIKLINFVFDKGLKYADINKIMGTSSEAGFGKYKLIVQGRE